MTNLLEGFKKMGEKMKFWEALKLVDEGKTVTQTSYFIPVNKTSLNSSLAEDAFSYWEDEWEVYQEPEKLLSFEEVVKGLKEGKTYRRKAWPNPEYTIRLFLPGIMEGNNASPWFPYPEDFAAADWLEVS